MPLNAATYAEELALKAGKPSPPVYGKKGKRVRGWKGFYGSVHDIVSCRRIGIHQLTGAVQLSVRGQSVPNDHPVPLLTTSMAISTSSATHP